MIIYTMSRNLCKWEKYYKFLIDYMHLHEYSDEYYKLLNYLFCKPFIFSIPMDANRYADGEYVRQAYQIDNNVDLGDEPITVLEVLIALAIRIDNEYIGIPSDDHPEEFFWEMLSNLGLDYYNDDMFFIRDVDHIVNRWLSRDISELGEGGIFPLTSSDRDQRCIEIWDQAMEYLTENY